MSTVDDDIRTALDAGIPEVPPIEPASLADGLRARAGRRRRRRRLGRGVGVAGALVVVVLLASTVARRDGADVRVVADGSDTTTTAETRTRPLAAGFCRTAYMLPPALNRSLTMTGDDLAFIGEVRAVGEERPVLHTVPTGPNADIPMPTFDYSPVEVDVVEYLHVRDGVAAPDPIRLRMIDMEPFGGIGGSETTSPSARPPLTELLPVGSQILVFASAPVDTGDGLAATPSTVFSLTDEGVIDEHGTVVPMDEIRAMLVASGSSTGPGTTVTPSTAPDDISFTEPGPLGIPDGRIRITVPASHCVPLTTELVTVLVHLDPAIGMDPTGASDLDEPMPAGPEWRVLAESMPVVGLVEDAPAGSEGTPGHSLITVDVPATAAQWLVTYQERGGVLWANPTGDRNTSCDGAPSPPTIPG